MSVKQSLRCDVAIAGGGMVGLSLAAALAQLPLHVVVVEPVVPGADEQPSFDARTTALSGGSRRVLEGIGAWAAVAAGATPIRRIHVSERGAFGTAILTADIGKVRSTRRSFARRWSPPTPTMTNTTVVKGAVM